MNRIIEDMPLPWLEKLVVVPRADAIFINSAERTIICDYNVTLHELFEAIEAGREKELANRED
jgi:hypothetical protein